MKKGYLLGVLFFASLWGVSETVLGGYLYNNNVAYPSVPLTIIAFVILTIAKIYLPQKASATAIGSIAMLYKFLNTPFFACHLLAIFLLGASFDLVFHLFKIRNKAMLGFMATYLGYILFAFSITYIFRYRYWIEAGSVKIIRYVGISGTFAAIGNLISVPVSFYLGKILKERMVNPFEFKSRLATAGISLVTLTIWFMGIARCF